jgi:hypothetical protein
VNWFKDNPLTIIMGIGYWHPSKGGTPHRKDEHMACDVQVGSLELLMLKALKKLQISTSGKTSYIFFNVFKGEGGLYVFCEALTICKSICYSMSSFVFAHFSCCTCKERWCYGFVHGKEKNGAPLKPLGEGITIIIMRLAHSTLCIAWALTPIMPSPLGHYLTLNPRLDYGVISTCSYDLGLII